MYVFELIAEDLTHLGTSMGTEYTTRASLGIYKSQELAIAGAHKHYCGNEKITWKQSSIHPDNPYEYARTIRSQYLGYVMYWIIQRVVVE